MQYILSLDQGTSSSRAILYDENAEPIATKQQEFEQIFPQPGWVEHNAEEIWETQSTVAQKVIQQKGLNSSNISAIGITNQRETTVIWDWATGKPIYNAIVWQDRRTKNYCNELKNAGHESTISEKTGLLIDAYFSATKIKWILDNVDGARSKAENGELAFGTIDSWLIWNMTNGALHITDVSNASRTMIYNIHELQWDEELLQLFNIPSSMLPTVKASSELYGKTKNSVIGDGIPIAGIAGDQQAALFGQMCLEEGMAKCTYGTGCFLMMNTGNKAIASENKLLTTIGWQIGAGNEVTYSLEGSVFMGGAVIQWLRDGLELFEEASTSESLANMVEDNGGIVFVPALTGLGAPHWDPNARGSIFGITRGTTKAHLTRAALESICYQVNDVLETMKIDSDEAISELRVDGGATANNLLVQFQSDISGIEVIRPVNLETTALGAAYLAGIAVGLWDVEQLKEKWKVDKSFHSSMSSETVEQLKKQWAKGVERAKNWAE